MNKYNLSDLIKHALNWLEFVLQKFTELGFQI